MLKLVVVYLTDLMNFSPILKTDSTE